MSRLYVRLHTVLPLPDLLEHHIEQMVVHPHGGPGRRREARRRGAGGEGLAGGALAVGEGLASGGRRAGTALVVDEGLAGVGTGAGGALKAVGVMHGEEFSAWLE
jgi:hypothetical protein